MSQNVVKDEDYKTKVVDELMLDIIVRLSWQKGFYVPFSVKCLFSYIFKQLEMQESTPKILFFFSYGVIQKLC